jgi:hypothetical protein
MPGRFNGSQMCGSVENLAGMCFLPYWCSPLNWRFPPMR